MLRTEHYFEFNTESGGKYLLDSKTGAVIATNEIMRKAIGLYATKNIEEVGDELKKKHPAKEVDGIISFIQRWDKQFGGFYLNEKSKVEVREKMDAFQEADIEKYLIDGNTYQLIINLTEDCNFRCKYCYLTDVYDYTRNRTSAKLELETGVKALDLFFEILKPIAKKIPGKLAGVTFYGGEPLLMYSTIKKLIDYAKTHSPTPLLFNITSNGYILNDEMMDFFVANKINIAISLDGNKENHDRNRVLVNGKGTFDVVYKNIKRFQEKYPDYDRLNLLSVYDFKTDLEANVRFFEEEKLPRIVFLNSVSNLNTNYYDRFSDEEIKAYNQQKDKLSGKYIDSRKRRKPISEYIRVFYVGPSMVILRPKLDNVRPFIAPFTGTCIPGMKINVRTDGTLDICERVNKTFPIGHVDTGLDYTAIKKLLNLYNSTITKECDNCTLNKNCTLCFAQCNRKCAFSLPESLCEDFHNSFRSYCKQVYSVLEKNPLGFRDVENKVAEDILFYS